MLTSTEHHQEDDLLWGMLRQWFNILKNKSVNVKEHLGLTFLDIDIPDKFHHHTCAVQDYVTALHKLSDAIEDALEKE